MSNFSFVSDKVLRVNLDITFDHVIDLLALTESDSYKRKTVLVSNLRKTIVIHTASIIEALLLWRLKKEIDGGDIEMDDEWKYLDIKILHDLNDSEQIIAGRRKKETKNIDRLDFNRVIDLCHKHGIIGKKLAEDAHTVREWRNRLHIGGLAELERKYTPSDLKFVFGVAKKVKDIASK